MENLCTSACSSLLSFSDLGVHTSFVHKCLFFFFLSLVALSVWCFFLSFLKYIFPGVPPAWPMGSPVSCGMFLELAVSGEVQLLASAHGDHPWSPSAASNLTHTPCTCAQLVMQLN